MSFVNHEIVGIKSSKISMKLGEVPPGSYCVVAEGQHWAGRLLLVAPEWLIHHSFGDRVAIEVEDGATMIGLNNNFNKAQKLLNQVFSDFHLWQKYGKQMLDLSLKIV